MIDNHFCFIRKKLNEIIYHPGQEKQRKALKLALKRGSIHRQQIFSSEEFKTKSGNIKATGEENIMGMFHILGRSQFTQYQHETDAHNSLGLNPRW